MALSFWIRSFVCCYTILAIPLTNSSFPSTFPPFLARFSLNFTPMVDIGVSSASWVACWGLEGRVTVYSYLNSFYACHLVIFQQILLKNRWMNKLMNKLRNGRCEREKNSRRQAKCFKDILKAKEMPGWSNRSPRIYLHERKNTSFLVFSSFPLLSWSFLTLLMLHMSLSIPHVLHCLSLSRVFLELSKSNLKKLISFFLSS